MEDEITKFLALTVPFIVKRSVYKHEYHTHTLHHCFVSGIRWKSDRWMRGWSDGVMDGWMNG